MKKRLALHILLFVVTFATTTLIQGPIYAVGIMGILLAHELGHYLQARRYGVEATFPIFIPMVNVFGTMGAVIAMKTRIPDRKALFDIGVTGPLVGLLFAIPAVVLGIYLSDVRPVPKDPAGMLLGEPLLFTWLSHLIRGPIPEGYDLFIHPIGFAGWAALFVTSINLIPTGQLDGGHVMYAMLGQRRAKYVSYLAMAGLFYLGYHFHPMWYFFLVLILFFLLKHPAPENDDTPIDPKRFLLGVITFALMVICFSPIPFQQRV